MSLSPIYERWEEETLQRGEERGRNQVLSEAVPALLDFGLTIEQVAARLRVDVAEVQRTLQARSTSENQS